MQRNIRKLMDTITHSLRLHWESKSTSMSRTISCFLFETTEQRNSVLSLCRKQEVHSDDETYVLMTVDHHVPPYTEVLKRNDKRNYLSYVEVDKYNCGEAFNTTVAHFPNYQVRHRSQLAHQQFFPK